MSAAEEIAARGGGPLAEGWRYQPGTPAYGDPYAPDGMSGPGAPVSEAALAAALEAASR